MSDAPEDAELKGGHPPAMKVGGMRVTTHTKKHEKPPEEKPTEEEVEEYGVPEKVDKHKQQVEISGAVIEEKKAYPEAAVRAIHEKPLPTHQKMPASHANTKIFQPQKQ